MIKKMSIAFMAFLLFAELLLAVQEVKANMPEAPASPPSDVFDLFKFRRSVRDYLPTPVPREHILKIIDAARMAPTSGNQQPWKFLVIQDRAKLDQLAEATANFWVEEEGKGMNASAGKRAAMLEENRKWVRKYLGAPVLIVILTDSQTRYPSYNHWDGPNAASYLMLAARALGYGTVYATDTLNFDLVRKLFAIPEQYEIVCVTPLGVPSKWPDSKPKKPLESFVVFESFGK